MGVNNAMYKYEVDVSVLILFFNNPERFKKSFEQIRKARPSRLFLYQDGARVNSNDLEGIQACRDIVDKGIDWDCQVYKNYCEKNSGCDPSNFLAQKWAFSLTDKCIVLEDDDVPAVSFFRFCKEMLDKYENDTRITMITGLNFDEITPNIPYDYFFTSVCPIWGWASWKRVIDNWDSEYSFLNDEMALRQLKALIKEKKEMPEFIEFCEKHKESGIEYYESICASYNYLNSGLGITPTKNMIKNIGVSGGVHYSGDLDILPEAEKKIFTMNTYELNGEIVHPKYVIEEYSYKDRANFILCRNHPFEAKIRKIKILFLRIKYRGIIDTIKYVLKKLKYVLKKR